MAVEKIIPVVTTPLAFAALIVLVLGGVYGATRGRREGVGREVFWLILVFGALGNAAFLLQAYLGTEVAITGNVRDEADRPIGFATIDVPGVGRGLTLDDGSFQVAVPSSRERRSYDLVVSAPGHARQRVPLAGPRPAFQEIRLETRRTRLSDLVELRDTLSVTQNVGDPLLVLAFKVRDLGETRGRLTDIRIRLRSTDGGETTFFPLVVQKNGVPFQNQYLQAIQAGRDEAGAEFLFMLSPDTNRLGAMVSSLFAQFGPEWFAGCFNGKGLPADTTAFFERYFDEASFWREGAFDATLRVTVDDAPEERPFAFRLTAGDAARLKAMKGRLGRCAGLMGGPPQLGNLSYSDPTASNVVPIQMTWTK